jgi:hypothetical protein
LLSPLGLPSLSPSSRPFPSSAHPRGRRLPPSLTDPLEAPRYDTSGVGEHAEERAGGAGVAQQPNLVRYPARARPAGPLRRRPRSAATPKAAAAASYCLSRTAAAVVRAGRRGGWWPEGGGGRRGRRGGDTGTPALRLQGRGACRKSAVLVIAWILTSFFSCLILLSVRAAIEEGGEHGRAAALSLPRRPRRRYWCPTRRLEGPHSHSLLIL